MIDLDYAVQLAVALLETGIPFGLAFLTMMGAADTEYEVPILLLPFSNYICI